MSRRAAWRIGGSFALAGGIAAGVLALPITGWALVRPGGPLASDYVTLVALTLVAAVLGAIPGLLVGLLVAWLSGRRRGQGSP